MRIPIPVVIPLCLAVVGGVWWFGTRDHDFLTPPPEDGLAAVLSKAGGTLPSAGHADDSNGETETTQKIEPAPDQPPQLTDYRDEAVKDPDSLVRLARQMEARGKAQRALLAWERVLDSAAPDETRRAEAIQSIKRLRAALPDWNTNPAAAIAITIHAGTGNTTASLLTPVLEEVARELAQASSGILKITSKVTVGNEIPEHMGPAPIALWLAGPDEASPSTAVFAFTSKTPETLRGEVAKAVFKLIRNFVADTASLTVPEAIPAEQDPALVMRTHVTRLAWLELGSQLNKILE